MEICLIGTSTVLVVEGETIQKVIAPHNVDELLKSQGGPILFRSSANTDIPLKSLGSKKNNRSSKSASSFRTDYIVYVVRLPSPSTSLQIHLRTMCLVYAMDKRR